MLNMTTARLCLVAALAYIAMPAGAQSPESLDLTAVGKDPRWPWQKLRSEHPGEYERAVVPEPDGDEWFHVRIVVERPQVTVFVNGASAPCLVVKELSDRAHGSLGFWVGEGSGGHFANLRVTRTQ